MSRLNYTTLSEKQVIRHIQKLYDTILVAPALAAFTTITAFEDRNDELIAVSIDFISVAKQLEELKATFIRYDEPTASVIYVLPTGKTGVHQLGAHLFSGKLFNPTSKKLVHKLDPIAKSFVPAISVCCQASTPLKISINPTKSPVLTKPAGSITKTIKADEPSVATTSIRVVPSAQSRHKKLQLLYASLFFAQLPEKEQKQYFAVENAMETMGYYPDGYYGGSTYTEGPDPKDIPLPSWIQNKSKTSTWSTIS
ncbi:hypothetical protein B7494_g2802 [Chlorociboria aeruginascens]|nr:hypothetical protein B7494_g2802 [Chlorociboria aeruginascens]